MTMILKQIYKSFFSAIVLLSLLLSACDDWLTVAPEDQLLKENFWKKTEDVYSAMGAMYNAFRDAGMQSLLLGEVRADLVEITGAGFENYANIAESNITATNGAVSWDNYYRAINLANTLMYYDKEVFKIDRTFTKEMMDAVDAEALFIRSLSYFYLVRIWKDVPLVVHPSLSDTSNIFLRKSTESDVLSHIINDLLKAKDMAYTTQLMIEDADPSFRSGRANKYAIMALLADVYLWDEQYQKASDYCDSIINSGLYNLETYDTWFENFYPGNSKVESIFEIQFDDNLDGQENPIFYDLLPIYGTGNIRVDAQKVSLLLNDNDLRACNLANPKSPDPLWKYYGTSLFNKIKRSDNQRDYNFIYYRYADILLIKAEALNELGDFPNANYYLSLTKERAGLSHIDIGTNAGLRSAILEERAKEFLVEGKRWFDVLRVAKRNNFENKQLIISMILSGADIKQIPILRAKVYDPMSYYLPIPDKDIRTNPNLIQNSYYDR